MEVKFRGSDAQVKEFLLLLRTDGTTGQESNPQDVVASTVRFSTLAGTAEHPESNSLKESYHIKWQKRKLWCTLKYEDVLALPCLVTHY
jgi:hypothetical protein